MMNKNVMLICEQLAELFNIADKVEDSSIRATIMKAAYTIRDTLKNKTILDENEIRKNISIGTYSTGSTKTYTATFQIHRDLTIFTGPFPVSCIGHKEDKAFREQTISRLIQDFNFKFQEESQEIQ